MFNLLLALATFSIQTLAVGSSVPIDEASATYPCPAKCWCRDKAVYCQKLSLTNANLSSLIEQMSNNTEVLHLGSNLLTDFSLSVFKSLHELQELDLQFNQLRRIPENQHGYLAPTFKVINLDGNNITQLQGKDFLGYGGLNSLLIARNRISKLGEHDLEHLIHLSSLTFDSSQLQTISGGAFKKNEFLKDISFGNNELKVIEPGLLDPLNHLELADFYQNQIESIPDFIVSNNPKLTHLDLSSNRLTKLPKHAFANMTNYGTIHIDMSHNALISLQSSSFENSKELNVALYKNKINCDCPFIANFKEITKNYDVIIEEALCLTPSRVQGLEIDSVIARGMGCSLCDYYQDSCKNKGKCIISNPLKQEIKCECQPGYEGKRCENLSIDKLAQACENNKCTSYETCIPLSATTYNCTCNTDDNKSNVGICSPQSAGKKGSGTITSVVWIVIVIGIVVVVVGIFVAIYVVVTRNKRRTLLIDDVDDDGDNEHL